MDDSQTTSLEQIRALVDANSAVRSAGRRREEVYAWVEKTLVRHEYAGLRKPNKGLLRLYLAQMTGMSRCMWRRALCCLFVGFGRTRPRARGSGAA